MAKIEEQIPRLSKKTMDSRYRIAERIVIDNVNGLGANKLHRELRHKGFLNKMKPALVYLLCGRPCEETAQQIAAHIREGNGVACPQILIDVESYISRRPGKCKIVAHDGLDTVRALEILGVESLHVQISLLGYLMRSVEDLDDFFNWVASGVAINENQVVTVPLDKLLGF